MWYALKVDRRVGDEFGCGWRRLRAGRCQPSSTARPGSAGRGSPLAVVVDVVRNQSHGLRGHPSYADGLFQHSHR